MAKCGFDTKPQGVLPLDRAIAVIGTDSTGQKDPCVVSVRHADIPFVVLDFLAEDEFEVHHWYKGKLCVFWCFSRVTAAIAFQHGKKANILYGKHGNEKIEKITSKIRAVTCGTCAKKLGCGSRTRRKTRRESKHCKSSRRGRYRESVMKRRNCGFPRL